MAQPGDVGDRGDLGGIRLGRRGSAKIAATAEIRATQAATRTPMAMALTKALCAAATSSLPSTAQGLLAGGVGGGDRSRPRRGRSGRARAARRADG